MKTIARFLFGALYGIMSILGVQRFWETGDIFDLVGAVILLFFQPCVLEKIFEKILKVKQDISRVYVDTLKLFLLMLGVILMMPIAIKLYTNFDYSAEENALYNFAAMLRICVYGYYLFILFLFNGWNKKIKYQIFGCFYVLCTVMKSFTADIDNAFIFFLNAYANTTLDKDSYFLLLEGCLDPIKEAILTYIIFDTVDLKFKIRGNKTQKEDKVQKTGNGNIEEEQKSIMNEEKLQCQKEPREFRVCVVENDSGVCKEYMVNIGGESY